MLHNLGEMIKFLHFLSFDPKDDPLKHLDWDNGSAADGGPDPATVAKRINGYDLTTDTLLSSFGSLADDGTTSSGNWLYCGSYTEDGNMAARRDTTDTNDESDIGLYSNWSWCWPVNRRIIYNRASCDTNGDPWDSTKKVIWWDSTAGEAGEWKGGDVPDFGKTSNPSAGVGPFIMKPEGFGRLFGMGRADGPLPEHYEPYETPVSNNPIGTSQLNNPCITLYHDAGSVSNYPYVATTYRMVEHWQAGAMTRNLPWLAELVPDMFVEISQTLAAAKGLVHGDKVRVYNGRGEIEAFTLVTDRIKKLNIDGNSVEVVGIPWHFGYKGLATGSSANVLTPHVGDPNTTIPEFKAFLVNIEKKS
jgi:formate dehydrogenase major subunit